MITFSPEMRAVFYIYLFLLFLCGGHSVYAGTHQDRNSTPSTRGTAKKQHVKLNNTSQGDPLLDEGDIDADDEYRTDHDDDEGPVKFLATKYGVTDNWYLTFSIQPISNHYNRHFNTLPEFCGNSSPIYITQRVLRI